MSYTPEVPPDHVDPEFRSFLNRQFLDISNELVQTNKFIERREMPYKPQVGNIYYFGDPSSNSYDAAITAEGWWGYKSTGWSQIG